MSETQKKETTTEQEEGKQQAKQGSEEMKEEDFQQKFMQFQQLQQNIEQITQHTQQLQHQLAELEHSIDAIKGFEKSEKGSETLAPIANGIFMKAKIEDTTTLLVNVGADVVVEKSVEQVIGLLDAQQHAITQRMIEAEQTLAQFHSEMRKIYESIQDA